MRQFNLKRFRDAAFATLDESANTLKRMLNEIDFTAVTDRFNEVREDISETFATLRKKVKVLTDRFVIKVPFDRENQKLSFTIDDDTINVTVESFDGRSHRKQTTSTTIPEFVDTNNMIQRYDDDKKEMIFIFLNKLSSVTTNVENENTESDSVVEVTETVNGDIELEIDVNEEDDNIEAVSTSTNTIVENNNGELSHDELINMMLDMYASGASYRKIAAEVGMSDKTVARWIKKALN
jgi:hypothetical protein